MEATFQITCPCTGTIDRIFPSMSCYIHEGEILCIVTLPDGSEMELCSNFSGFSSEMSIHEGMKVEEDMVIANLEAREEDFCLCCD